MDIAYFELNELTKQIKFLYTRMASVFSTSMVFRQLISFSGSLLVQTKT